MECPSSQSLWNKYVKFEKDLLKKLPKVQKKLYEQTVNARVMHDQAVFAERKQQVETESARLRNVRSEEREALEKNQREFEEKVKSFKKSEAAQKIGEGIEAVLSIFAKAQMDAYYNTRRGFF